MLLSEAIRLGSMVSKQMGLVQPSKLAEPKKEEVLA